MTKVKATASILLIAGGLSFSPQTSALQNAGGGWWCEESTGYLDEAGWHVKAGACFYDPFFGSGGPSGGGELPPPPGGGGSGSGSGGSGGNGNNGATPPDLTDRDISALLKCALDNYLHNDVKFIGNQTMKKVNAWAFGLKNTQNSSPNAPQFVEWAYRNSNTSPGNNWVPIGGLTSTGYAYGRMYNIAFQARSDFVAIGNLDGAPPNRITGPISAFEMSLFIGGHEAGHLRKKMSEKNADWHGIDAVLKYRVDKGKKCSGK